ncbi:substrate-binding domain-containing protein [Streptomyces sp. NPDC001508]|uniref:substrate-binding domain-containing protein n=1 Tax=Streptomyces sp. NPDC001508 TaxID=3154656 RepID=UPI00332A378F
MPAEPVRPSHLLELGHRHIAYLGGLANHHFRPMHATAVGVLADAGLPLPPPWDAQARTLTVRAGKESGQDLLAGARRPSAVFCADDRLALGLLQALHESNLRASDDLAVVGFGDSPHATVATVPLTTVRRPLSEVRRRAVPLLSSGCCASRTHGS